MTLKYYQSQEKINDMAAKLKTAEKRETAYKEYKEKKQIF